MGLFGGSSGGDTSGGMGGGTDIFASKMRSPNSELDFSDPSMGGSVGSSAGTDDIQTRIQIEQQKAKLSGQVLKQTW